MKRYIYRVARENVVTGERAKRSRTIERYEPLKVGGLYALRSGRLYRVEGREDHGAEG